jgi:hypothetical protein
MEVSLSHAVLSEPGTARGQQLKILNLPNSMAAYLFRLRQVICAAASVSGRARLVPAESGRKWKGVKIMRISPCAIAGAIGNDTILPLFREK